MGKLYEGVRILDCTGYVAGPQCTSSMVSEGAEVVRLEPPVYGDASRGYGPFLGGVGASTLTNGIGKKSVEIDFKDPEGIALVKKMILDFDIFIESNRPGVMAKLGLAYEDLKAVKPDIIYMSISAFGQTGPWASQPGFDVIAQALAGLAASTGEPDGPPVRIGPYIGDVLGGLNAFAYLGAALYNKNRTGEGCYLDVSLYESSINCNPAPLDGYANFGIKFPRSGNHQVTSAPYGIFEGKNKQYIALTAPADGQWTNLCKLMNRPELIDDERYNSIPMRVKNRFEIVDIIQEWLNTFDDVEDAVAALLGVGVPAGKVREPWELLDCPHLKARDFFQYRDLPPAAAEKAGKNVHITTRPGVLVSDNDTPFPHPTHDVGDDNYILEKYMEKEELDALLGKWAEKHKRG